MAIIICLMLSLVTFCSMLFIMDKIKENTNIEISYDEFIDMLDNGEVEEVVLDPQGKIIITPKVQPNENYDIVYFTGYLNSDEFVARLEEADITFKREVQEQTNVFVDFFLTWILPFALIWGVMMLLYRSISKSGGMMGVGKSNAKVYVEKETGVTFKDVAGQEEAKESMTELVDFLHNPGKYTAIGVKLPKGALLV